MLLSMAMMIRRRRRV
ncbi:BnaCnng24790D [Brassica napus]|uniref:BnaCnng24790D protein n=1 Tax=Brassica napus TaxID=3708 RepID=A0A078ITI4_BRANA|nr:BnaCnng24790D [Brassica napus]